MSSDGPSVAFVQVWDRGCRRSAAERVSGGSGTAGRLQGRIGEATMDAFVAAGAQVMTAARNAKQAQMASRLGAAPRQG